MEVYMIQDPVVRRVVAYALAAVALFFIALVAVDHAEARAPRGGRSFSGSRTFSRPSAPPRSAQQPPAGSTAFNRQPFGSGSFMRGMAGGLLGGMIGGMIFGGPAHGGMGGFGGSGIGLIEILLLGGVAWFIFKRFVRPTRRQATTNSYGGAGPYRAFDTSATPYDDGPMPDIAPAPDSARSLEAVRRSDPHFDPDLFREGAQDTFFKIQAAWMRQDLSLVDGLIGDDLASEYRRQLEEMKARGVINRLENIAVRSVEIIDAGCDRGFAWITVKFTANLLDYTVNAQTGEVVEGDPATPVKFEENWTFAAPEGTSDWKLEGVG
jgi:predicted lipid-binding transport protein (Tim44 family)